MKDCDLTSAMELPIASEGSDWEEFIDRLERREAEFIELLQKYDKTRKPGFYLTALKLKVRDFNEFDEVAAVRAISKFLKDSEMPFSFYLKEELKPSGGKIRIKILDFPVEILFSEEQLAQIREQNLTVARSVNFQRNKIVIYIYADLV